MLRILHICNALNRSGIESYIMNMYRNLDRSKIHFDFFLTEPPSAYDDEVLSLGGKIFRHVLKGNRLNLINIYRKEMKILAKQYDIVHIHAMSCKVFFIARYLKIYGVKNIIVHCHGCGHKGLVHKTLQFLLNKYVTERISCSDVAGKIYFGEKCYPKVKLIYNSIDVANFDFNQRLREKHRVELNLRDDELAFVSVGRYSFEKNHMFMLKIFSEIIKKNEKAKLFLVGWGDLESQIKEKIIEMNLTNNVILLGMRSDVGSLINAMDAFLLPSLFEGFPVVAVESQVNGLPIFLSGHITKLVDFSGLLTYIPLESSVENWAQKILEYDYSIERKGNMELARTSGFDVKIEAVKMQNYYFKLIESGAKNV